MILKVFTIYDSKVGAYLPPTFARSTGEMLRAFTQAVNDSGHNFCKFAEDYTLFEIGDFEDTKCQFVLKAVPVSLGRAIEFMRRDVDPAQSSFTDLQVVKES